MASNVERWRAHLCDVEGSVLPSADVRASARIALAAAEWVAEIGRDSPGVIWEGPTVADMLASILRGEGPGHLPPNEGQGGQKGDGDG